MRLSRPLFRHCADTDIGMADMFNIFETFLPQLLRYPNPNDPLNGEAAALLNRKAEEYDAKVKGKSSVFLPFPQLFPFPVQVLACDSMLRILWAHALPTVSPPRAAKPIDFPTYFIHHRLPIYHSYFISLLNFTCSLVDNLLTRFILQSM